METAIAPFEVLIHDNDKIHLHDIYLASSAQRARDKAVKALDDGVDLDEAKVVVRPFQNQ